MLRSCLSNYFILRICTIFAALKRIPRSKIVSEQQKLRLEAEKFVLLHATSPFLCRGFESFATTAQVAFLLEFIDGRALYECVWKYRETGKFPEHVAKFFAAQLVLALRDLHAQGFIHRDLKSGNVLVGKDGFIKVIDFGLAKKLVGGADGDPTERTQSMCGTHYVMAPEVFYREAYGFAIDWWYDSIDHKRRYLYICSPTALLCRQELGCRNLRDGCWASAVGVSVPGLQYHGRVFPANKARSKLGSQLLRRATRR